MANAEIDKNLLSVRRQILAKVDAGFPEFLGRTVNQYLDDIQPAQVVASELLRDDPESELILVDPRILFADQVRLFGLSVDPAVFYQPDGPNHDRPYALAARVVGLHKAGTLESKGNLLGSGWRVASPLEGINCDRALLENQVAVAFLGGRYQRLPGLPSYVESPARALAVERHLGSLRLTHYRRDQIDALVSVLMVRA